MDRVGGGGTGEEKRRRSRHVSPLHYVLRKKTPDIIARLICRVALNVSADDGFQHFEKWKAANVALNHDV